MGFFNWLDDKGFWWVVGALHIVGLAYIIGYMAVVGFVYTFGGYN